MKNHLYITNNHKFMETNNTASVSLIKKLDVKKLINYLIIPFIFLGLIAYFLLLNYSYKTLTFKFTKQTEIINNQNLIITNQSQKNNELSVIIKNYDKKFSFLQTNVAYLQQLTENLKKSSEDKDIKIKLLEQEKGSLESDAKSLRNTIVKMTAEIVEYIEELKKLKLKLNKMI